MAMAVDAARQYQPAARVDLALALIQILPERCDNTALDANVTGNDVGCGRHGSAADHQIKLAHAAPFSVGRSSATVVATKGRGKGSKWPRQLLTGRPSP